MDWRVDPGKVRLDPGKKRDEEDTRSEGVNSLTGVGMGAASRRDGKWVGGRRGGCSAGSVDGCG